MHKVSLSQGLIQHFYCGSGTLEKFGNFFEKFGKTYNFIEIWEISLKNLGKTYNFFDHLEKF